MSTFSYLASFDLRDRRNRIARIYFERAGSTGFVVDLRPDSGSIVQQSADTFTSVSVFNHYQNYWGGLVGVDTGASTGILHSVADRSFADHVLYLMQAGATSAGWPNVSDVTCTFSNTTLRYTFRYQGDAFDSIVFENYSTARLFGFEEPDPGLSGETATGTTLPQFCLRPELSAVSTPGVGDGIDYEPQGISASTVALIGQPFGITRSCVPTFRDWTQQSEQRDRVIRLAAEQVTYAGVIFSHQEMVERISCVYPFVVAGNGFGDGLDYLFRLRPDACTWSSGMVKRAANEMDDSHFDVRYQTQVLGVFT